MMSSSAATRTVAMELMQIGPACQVAVAKALTVRIREIGEHVDVAGICAPGGDLESTECVRVDSDRQRGRLLIAEPLDPKANTRFSKRPEPSIPDVVLAPR